MTRLLLPAPKWKTWTFVAVGAVGQWVGAAIVRWTDLPVATGGVWLLVFLLWTLILVLAVLAARRIELLTEGATQHETVLMEIATQV